MQTQTPLNAHQRRTIQIFAAAVGASVIAALCLLGNNSRPIRYFVVVLGILAIVTALILAIARPANRQQMHVVLGTAGIGTGCTAALLQGGSHPALSNALWVLTVILLIIGVFRMFRGTQ
jgi:hypothetical protein